MQIEVDFQPVGRHVRVAPGATILEAAQEAGVGLSAICGGGGSCGACRVRLALRQAQDGTLQVQDGTLQVQDGSVSPPNTIEQAEFSPQELAVGLRLACQTVLHASTRVDVPPESLTAPQRTQVEGEERPVELAPLVQAFDLELAPAAQSDLRADWERLGDALAEAGALAAGQGLVHRSVRVIKDLPGLLRENDWKLRVGLRGNEVVSLAAPGSPLLGLAVDIGTTKLAAYLLDLVSGETLALRGMMNPQIAYGEDVMARIAYAMEREDGLQVLQRDIVKALNLLACDLCADAGAEAGAAFLPELIVEAVVVGNTAMHHLFLGLPVRQLGLSPYVAAISAPLDVRASDLGLALAPGATVHLLPNVAGFVGADHVAMLLATGTHQLTAPPSVPPKGGEVGLSAGGEVALPPNRGGRGGLSVVVSLDIGTNTEVTLAARGRLIACSTASGPAFEGAHIRDGMRAAEGAIERVRVLEGKIEYQTIGGGPPVGMCGSGILDAIAQLKLAGVLDRRGSMRKEHPLVRRGESGPEVVIAPARSTRHGRDIVLSRKDVSEIQLSKGAIRAGIEILLEQAGLTPDDVEQVIIAGAFGSYIDVDNAVAMGMFPPLPSERFRQVGNAAGIGAKLSLLSSVQRAEASALAARVEYLELTNHPGFVTEFARAMSL